MLSRLQEVRYRCHLLPQQQERGWRDQGPLLVAPEAGQAMPDTMISTEFRCVWIGGGGGGMGGQRLGRSSAASFWRPVGPPGYVALGDVCVSGRDPPPRPVRMYKDAPALAAAAVNASGSGDAPASEGPRLLPPTGYALVFRCSASPPLTLWRPLPPRGYVDVGCVAWPAIEEPPLGLVRCLRSDLAAPGRVYDSAVWAGASSDNPYWRASVWPVDHPAGTFVAVKGEGRPGASAVREPVY